MSLVCIDSRQCTLSKLSFRRQSRCRRGIFWALNSYHRTGIQQGRDGTRSLRRGNTFQCRNYYRIPISLTAGMFQAHTFWASCLCHWWGSSGRQGNLCSPMFQRAQTGHHRKAQTTRYRCRPSCLRLRSPSSHLRRTCTRLLLERTICWPRMQFSEYQRIRSPPRTLCTCQDHLLTTFPSDSSSWLAS